MGQQFLDNTANSDRALDAYFVSNLRINYVWNPTWTNQLSVAFLINNLLDETYESNGYTYSFIAGGLQTFNFYYPQAGRNFMLKVGVGF